MKNNKKRKYGLSDFFGGYLDNLGQLALVNLLFCIPLIISGGAILLLNLFVPLNIFAYLLLIPLLSPFSAGLFYCVRRVTMNEELKALRDFKKGMRSSWKSFLVNGLIGYPVVGGIALTFSLYRGNLSNPVILMAFISSLIFVLFYISLQNSLLTMLVTVDISPGQALKNSVLLFLGGIGGHIKVILSLALVSIMVFSVFLLIRDALISLLILTVPLLLFLPVLCAYIVVYNTYQTIEKRVINPYTDEKNEVPVRKEREEEYIPDTDELIRLSKGDPEEFVFLGGKMLKRKKIAEMLEKSSAKEGK